MARAGDTREASSRREPGCAADDLLSRTAGAACASIIHAEWRASVVRSERVPAPQPARASAEHAFAHVIGLLERLADVLADPAADPREGSEFEAVVCSVIAYLRATGASNAEVSARLTHLVQGAAAGSGRPPHETAARVAAVVAWCERANEGWREALPA
jgi:hypothetical protein